MTVSIYLHLRYPWHEAEEAAAKKLTEMVGEVAVIVFDYGVAEVFGLDEQG